MLYAFTGGLDGGAPYGGVVRDSAGNLYGTSFDDGAHGAGVVFKLDTSGNETVLHAFTGGAGGAYPYSGVILDAAGNLYGTTSAGGNGRGFGIVYELDPSGNETVLHNFKGKEDGQAPYAAPIRAPSGHIHGTAFYGGADATYGVVYELK